MATYTYKDWQEFCTYLVCKNRYILDKERQKIADEIVTLAKQKEDVLKSESIFWRARIGEMLKFENGKDVTHYYSYDEMMSVPIDKSQLFSLLKLNLSRILWCSSFSAGGIGAGLINSRERETKKGNLYYFLCFIFVGFIATIAAFTATLTFNNSSLHSYATAALVGIIIGFTGEKLPEKIEQFSSKNLPQGNNFIFIVSTLRYP